MKIAIFYIGGTIGCTGAPRAPLSGPVFEAAFQALVVPVIRSQYPESNFCFIPFGRTMDSTNLQPTDWCKIADLILQNYTDHDAFIILHGTDTMAWTASALSFLLTGMGPNGYPCAILSKPVIVTGSQLPLFYEVQGEIRGTLFNTDALQNVCGAVASAQTGVPEVCLFFNNTLFRGNRTIKTDANEFRAFSSPNYPSLGECGVEFSLRSEMVLPPPPAPEVALDDEKARRVLMEQLQYMTAHIDQTLVYPFPAFPAAYNGSSAVLANMLKALMHQNVDGIILESYGEGNFPSGNPDEPRKGAIYQVLKEAREVKGIALIDCTQVTNGVVNTTTYASGSWLGEVGAVGSYDMTSIAALTKLIYLSILRHYPGYNWGLPMVEHLMQTNLAGEIMDIHRLDLRGKRFLAPGEDLMALNQDVILINDPARGPVLRTSAGKELWVALRAEEIRKMPGRLWIRENGELVFCGRDHAVIKVLYRPEGEAQLTQLSLESKDRRVELCIRDMMNGEKLKTLYTL